LQVGEKVEARFGGGPRFYPAVVTNRSGMWSVVGCTTEAREARARLPRI
jgi:hypothetical protein